MKREILNYYLGHRVIILFKDKTTVYGKLEFIPGFSGKYGYKPLNTYCIEEPDGGAKCFDCKDVKKIRLAEQDRSYYPIQGE